MVVAVVANAVVVTVVVAVMVVVQVNERKNLEQMKINHDHVVLYLRIEKSGAAGKGDGRRRLGIMDLGAFFLVICYYYTDYVYSTTNDSNWGSRHISSRGPATSKFNLSILFILY